MRSDKNANKQLSVNKVLNKCAQVKYLIFIDIHLEDRHIVIGLRDLLQHRRDQLARTAPSGVEINNDQKVFVAELL